MGCDIQIFAEAKNKETGKWEKVEDQFSLDEYDKKRLGKDKGDSPFDNRNYSVFAFLADVRNYDCCEPLSQPKGLPDDSEYLNSPSPYEDGYNFFSGKPIPEGEWQTIRKDIEEDDYHSRSHLYLKELLDFDYDKTFWNRRITRITYREDGSVAGSNGACLAEEGEGEIVSYRKNLGDWFFVHLEELKQIGEPENVRIVFWFDN